MVAFRRLICAQCIISSAAWSAEGELDSQDRKTMVQESELQVHPTKAASGQIGDAPDIAAVLVT
jgi:hypothetical protein